MSTLAPIEPVVEPAEEDFMPSPESLYRMSIEKYEAMVASGVFSKRDRFHLINGFLVAKMTEYLPHTYACDAVRFNLEPMLPAGFYLRLDKPLRIPTRASEPQPDLALVRGTWRDYEEKHPEPHQAPFVVEVASTSLREDRGMALVYGKGGIAVYWIVNLVDRQVEVYQVEVYTGAGSRGYQQRKDYKAGEQVPFVLDGVERGRIAVADILPRQPSS
jgi:Uma2 family endonuclease